MIAKPPHPTATLEVTPEQGRDRLAAFPALRRRQFLAVSAIGLFCPAILVRAADKTALPNPCASFDREMEAFMAARKVPGGALAVVKDGRLAYARGYGWADREQQIRAQPDTLFRIASISKPITAVAIMKLVEEQRLRLDEPAFALLGLKPVLAAGKSPDPRLHAITVRHLLQHTAGWDRDKSGDPMFRSRAIAEATQTPAPAMPEAIIRYMLGQPLDFDPGARYAYSNFGYCVLGRVIEKVTGLNYEKFLHQQVLARAGIRQMRLGTSLTSGVKETRYYTSNNDRGRSVFGDTAMKVPEPYGTFCLEAMDAHGGWLASAVDLARFAAALDDPQRSPLLSSVTCGRMYEPPAPPVSRQADGRLEDSFYACGWMVRPRKRTGKANYWHSGSLPGTSSLLVRRWDGLSWAAVFNQRSTDKKLPDGAIDGALHRAADAVQQWPTENLFERLKG